jgi:hypothetical protein
MVDEKDVIQPTQPLDKPGRNPGNPPRITLSLSQAGQSLPCSWMGTANPARRLLTACSS